MEKLLKKISSAMEKEPFNASIKEDLLNIGRETLMTDEKLAVEYLKLLSSDCEKNIPGMVRADLEQAQKSMAVHRSALIAAGAYDFESYLMAVEFDREPQKKFYIPRRGYLRRYVQAYQSILDGETDFLSMSMPKRAVHHDCPVLTTNGFKKHGELVPGDYVFGETGHPVKVLQKHPDQEMQYKITFSNGEEFFVTGDHRWKVYDKNCAKYKIVSTEDMLSTGLKVKSGTWRYRIPHCNPLEMPSKDLPVKPYSLGAWLGDGTTAKPIMTNDVKDVLIIEQMKKDGYEVTSSRIDKNYGTLVTNFSYKLSDALKSCGMCHRSDKGNKHIPEEYFTASKEQRLELLAGLIDTDGYVEKDKHRVHISTVLPRLRDDILKLVGTFGVDCRYLTYEARTSTSGVIGRRDVYNIYFAPDFDIPTVLPRKKINPTSLPRMISVRKIEKISDKIIGNCITVEGGLYRIGIRQVLTHNCGKSQLGINFTNMISGKFPDKSTLMEGTGDDLVKSFYEGCLEYLDVKGEYCFNEIFPEAKLVQTNADTKIINLQSRSRFPTVMCRSIDARQVGLSEATNLLYLDDCVEGYKEAMNRQRLDEKWKVITGDIIGRAIEGTPIVICGTRYSIYDPIGRLQEEMRKQGKRMRIIETPALDPVTDESNFEYVRDGKRVFTTKYFRDQRDMLSAEQFESEFQQNPFESKGLLFPEDKLNRYFQLPVDRDPDAIIAICDTAEGGGDSVMLPIAYLYGEDVFIEDVVFDNSTPEHTKPQCAKKLVQHKVQAATFESNLAGTYYARDVEELVTKMGGKISIRTKRTVSNKQTRIEIASDGILKHFYFKDKSLYKPQDQYGLMMKELTTYTRTGKVPHDDAPDGLSLLENEIRNRIFAKTEVIKSPW